MSELGVAVPGRSPMTEVGHPSWTVFAHVARAAARSAAMWGGVFAVFAVVQLNSYTSIYTTQASRDQLARAYGTNPGLNALLGAPRAMDTVAGWAQWRFVGILGPLGCIWAVLTATRLLRGGEDAGRYDLRRERRRGHGPWPCPRKRDRRGAARGREPAPSRRAA